MVTFNKEDYAKMTDDAARAEYMTLCFGDDQAAKDAAVV